MKKKILRALGLLLLLSLVALIVVVAINQFDETLDPQAAAWGEPRPATVPEAENGYYALLGLGAPLDADPAAFARAWMAEARAAAKENRMEKSLAKNHPARPLPCNPSDVSCLDTARANAAELTSTLSHYKQDIARYESLLAAKRYEEVLDYRRRITSFGADSGPLVVAQHVYLTQAALAAARGDIEAAVGAVERDIAMCRLMLGGARTMVAKAIAVHRYWTSLAFLADLMRQQPTALEPFAPRLRVMLAGIDASALRLDTPLENEFATYKQFVLDAVNAGFNDAAGFKASFAEKLFYLPNATINGLRRDLFALTEALQRPPSQIKDAAQRATQASLDQYPAWSYLYNPIGKDSLIAGATSASITIYYALRLHDLDAFNRLVGLRLEAMLAKISTAQAAEFAAKSDPRFHDPYTGKPMAWDAVKGRFHFTVQGYIKRHPDFAFSIDGSVAFVAL